MADPDIEVSLESLSELIKSFEVRFEALSLLELKFTAAEAKRARFTALDIDLMKSRFRGLVIVEVLEASSFTDGFAIIKSSGLVRALATDLVMATAVLKLGVTLPSTLLGPLSASRQQELLNLGLVGNATGMAHLDDRSTTPQLGMQSGTASMSYELNARTPPFAETSGVNWSLTPSSGSFFPFDEGDLAVAEHGFQSSEGSRSGLGKRSPSSPNERSSVSGMGRRREKSGKVLGLHAQGDKRREPNDTSGTGHSPSINDTREFLRESSSRFECPAKALPEEAREKAFKSGRRR